MKGSGEAYVLDTRGLYCPLPIIRTRARLGAIDGGEILEVLSDDPVILEDMPAFCRSHGHDYLGGVEEPGVFWRVRVRKSRADRTEGR